MKRGDIAVVAAPGDFGKPRPAVIVQADALTELGLMSVTVCLITSAEASSPLFRVSVPASPLNGLEKDSQIMVDKLFTVPKAKTAKVIGHLSEVQLVQLNRTLAFVVGLG